VSSACQWSYLDIPSSLHALGYPLACTNRFPWIWFFSGSLNLTIPNSLIQCSSIHSNMLAVALLDSYKCQGLINSLTSIFHRLCMLLGIPWHVLIISNNFQVVIPTFSLIIYFPTTILCRPRLFASHRIIKALTDKRCFLNLRYPCQERGICS